MAMVTVPRVVHVTWKTRDLPDWGAACVASWAALHPRWTLRIWADADVDGLLEVRGDEALRSAYAALPSGAARADLARYAILRAHGGVYCDLDVQCLRSFEPLLAAYDGRRAAVVGRETAGGRCGNAVLVSCAGHGLWDEVLAVLKRRVSEKRGPWSPRDVCQVCGPGLLSDVVQGTAADVDVLKVDAFYPVAWRPAHEYALLPKAPSRDAWCAHLWRGTRVEINR